MKTTKAYLRPTLVWLCPFCDQPFLDVNELKKHIASKDYVMPPIKFIKRKPL
jgi:hypothetical protein